MDKKIREGFAEVKLKNSRILLGHEGLYMRNNWQ